MANIFRGTIPTLPQNSNQSSKYASVEKLFKALWSCPDSKYQLGTLDRQTKRFRNIPVTSVAEACKHASLLSANGSDAYFAIAGYETPESRTASNTLGAGGFWLDIDCSDEKAEKAKGYRTTAEAELAVKNFCQTVGTPFPTHIVDSGGGLHVYWAFDRFLPREPWQAYAKRLKDLTHTHGLLADDSRTADIASVLRIPETLNHKYDPPRPVTVLHATETPINIHTILDAINAAHNRLGKILPASPKKTNTPSITTSSIKTNDATPREGNSKFKLTSICALLKNIDPEEGGHDGWVRIGMAIHTVADGDDEGLELFDQWSQRGGTYPGRRMIETKWRSFASSRGDRCNIGTIINRVTAAGLDWKAICSEAESPFERCEYTVIGTSDDTCNTPIVQVTQPTLTNPLDRYSLRGMADEIANEAVAQVPILGGLANMGQATSIFAKPNSGKTLIVFNGLCEDIRQHRLNASALYYVNVDDSAKGIADKLAIADEHGFHLLSDGYQKFKAGDLLGIISGMVESDQARGVVIVLDTVKKFTNVMDKTKASQFTKVIRRFVLKGGTIVALAHTNKRPGADGKPVYGGTSDIVDDFDCAYTIDLGLNQSNEEKVVVFENIKRRGNNPNRVAYRYSVQSDLSYAELLSSVEKLDPDQAEAIAQKPKDDDTKLVAAIQSCISKGINTKMSLADAAAKSAETSKRSALSVIERYTGDDPAVHKWKFAVRERGAKVFTLLDNSTPPTSTAT